jgi:hypothetical protein
VPLGAASGRLPAAASASQIPLADRPYIWSFIGTTWANRKDKLSYLSDLQPSICNLQPGWTAVANSAAEYVASLRSSKFIPCPRGTNIETFRLWEALEYGCIPLVVREEGDDQYYNWLRSHLPGLFAAASWQEAPAFVNTLLANPAVAQAYAGQLQADWRIWRSSLQMQVQQLLHTS